ncbi:MAG: lysylphosphatidylglycerol synthase transmembrane domain-containing protein [Planctomycetota bacterium]
MGSEENTVGEVAPDAAPRSALKRYFPYLKILLAIALIALVVSWVDFRDRLVVTRPSAATECHVGTLRLAADEVSFESQDGAFHATLIVAPGGIVEATLQAAGGEKEHYQASRDPWIRGIEYRRGLITLLMGLRLSWFALGFCCYLIASLLAATRWQRLLRSTGINATWYQALRFTFIGLFCNNFVPGLTGGDLVKAIYVARTYRDQRADAVISVIVDRVLGLLGLALVAAVAVLRDPGRFREVFVSIYGLLGGVGLGALFFFSRRLRGWLRVDALLARLPFSELLQKVDRSIFLFRDRLGTLALALAMSVTVHLAILTGMGFLGRALGIEMPFPWYFVLVPIGFIVQAVPITPQGIGVGEAVLVYYFATAGVPAPQAFALMLCYRLVMTGVSLLGGLFLVGGRERGLPRAGAEVPQGAQAASCPGSG